MDSLINTSYGHDINSQSCQNQLLSETKQAQMEIENDNSSSKNSSGSPRWMKIFGK